MISNWLSAIGFQFPFSPLARFHKEQTLQVSIGTSHRDGMRPTVETPRPLAADGFRLPTPIYNFPFSFAALPLLIIILQPSCYTLSHEVLNQDAILQLEQKYSVHLNSSWTTKQAHSLLKVFESIPLNMNLPFSTWNISNDDVENGIKIESKDKIKFVTISRDIFPVEGSQEVVSPGKHLYYAVVQYITENGTNRAVIELILQERYGIYVPSYASLPDETKNKTIKRYSDFENRDLMLIISVFEAFPQALHKIPRLKYIVRRIDYEDDENRGVSHALTSRGYIEFAESIFTRGNFRNFINTRRIIAHEKAHFLWAYVFNRELKTDWAKLGGWHRDSSESGWSTTKERSAFVSDYASEKDPNEDMAESIANYLVSPHRLRSCCTEKYEFIHENMLLYVKRWGTSNFM